MSHAGIFKQDTSLASVRSEWLNLGLSTEPADRERAERAVKTAYSAVNLPPPPALFWVPSPFAGTIAAQLVQTQLNNRPTTARFRRLRRQLTSRARKLTDGAWSDIGRELQPVQDQVWDGVGLVAESAIRLGGEPTGEWLTYVWNAVRAQGGHWFRDVDLRRAWGQLWRPARGTGAGGPPPIAPCYGHHDAGWLGQLDAAERIAGDSERLVGLVELARSSGWWWPTREAVVLSDRPASLEIDDDGRLHCERGPALVYRDGWSVHAWHGVRVPPWVIERPHLITLQMVVRQPNVEMRRVLLERYGYERYVRTVGSRVHSDDWGTLWRAPLFGDEPLVMVQVLNATPEPDGRFKDYFLRVPPSVSTAHEAVAWTFGASRESYAPQVQA